MLPFAQASGSFWTTLGGTEVNLERALASWDWTTFPHGIFHPRKGASTPTAKLPAESQSAATSDPNVLLFWKVKGLDEVGSSQCFCRSNAALGEEKLCCYQFGAEKPWMHEMTWNSDNYCRQVSLLNMRCTGCLLRCFKQFYAQWPELCCKSKNGFYAQWRRPTFGQAYLWMPRDFLCGSSGSTSKPSVRCSLLVILDIKTTCLTSQSQTSLQIWTATRCSASFGGWTIASVRVLALELLEIHSLEEKLWTFASTPGARWLTLATPSAPTCVFACASLISAPCLQHLDPQFVFASTKSLLVVTDGAASSCLIGLLALVIPSGSTTSSASVSASLPHKPMDVLSLLSRSRSCASRVEPNWPPQWKVVSCVPQWALVCASGTNVLCHQLRELPCFPASIYWTPRAPRPNHSHMDPESSEVAVMSAFKCWALQYCEPSQPSSTCLISGQWKGVEAFLHGCSLWPNLDEDWRTEKSAHCRVLASGCFGLSLGGHDAAALMWELSHCLHLHVWFCFIVHYSLLRLVFFFLLIYFFEK